MYIYLKKTYFIAKLYLDSKLVLDYSKELVWRTSFVETSHSLLMICLNLDVVDRRLYNKVRLVPGVCGFPTFSQQWRVILATSLCMLGRAHHRAALQMQKPLPRPPFRTGSDFPHVATTRVSAESLNPTDHATLGRQIVRRRPSRLTME